MKYGLMKALTGLSVALVMSGCGGCDDDPELIESRPGQLGKRGETCTASNDCVDDLACVSSVCVSRNLNVAPSAKECKVIECVSDEECCEERELSGLCETLKDECSSEGMFSDQACDRFAEECECDLSCTSNRCVSTGDDDECEDDDDCNFGGGGDDFACRKGSCEEVCKVDANCPYLHSCRDGECVDTGCTDDRECIALMADNRAQCVDGDCSIECVVDTDCLGELLGYSVCQDSRCVSAGCETAQECRIVLGVQDYEDSTLDFVCE